MYAVGHLALGYLTGKTTTKLLNVNVNIPLLFLVSITPDIDILIFGLPHRGPTHSLITSILVFIPIIAYYRKKAVPYFIAFTQHSLIGDYLTIGGTQLLWPLNSNHYYALAIEMNDLPNILLEWIFFLTAIAILIKTGNAQKLLQPHSSNPTLSITASTVLLPPLLYSLTSAPPTLIIPHFIYLAIFTLFILTGFKAILKKN